MKLRTEAPCILMIFAAAVPPGDPDREFVAAAEAFPPASSSGR